MIALRKIMRPALGLPALGLLALGLLCMGNAFAADAEPAMGMSMEAKEPGAESMPAKPTPYPLGVCVVSSDTLGAMGKPVTKVYEGREVRFCCEECVPKYEADAAKYNKLIDAQIVEQQKAHYPLTTCLVSGDELGGEMGEPIDYVYDNRLVRLCCKGCVKKINANPAKYMKALDEAIIKVGNEDYKLKNCLVSDEPLGSMGDAVDTIVAGRLVKLCCDGCSTKLRRDPAKYLALLEAAEAGETAAH